MGSPGSIDGRRPKLLTAPFVTVCVSGLTYVLVFGMTLPVLTRYATDELNASAVGVGNVFAVFAVVAVVSRPSLGFLGDRLGRRWLVVAGGALTAVALGLHTVATSMPELLLLRGLVGAGHAAVIVGVTTMAVDVAPSSRRGEAASLVMVAIQTGMGLGPLFGEVLLPFGYTAIWSAGALLTVVSAALALRLPSSPRYARVSAPTGRFIHPAGLLPGVVLGIGMLGYAGWLAFIPLYGLELGLDSVAFLYFACAGSMVAVRLLGARLPDVIGAVPASLLAIGSNVAGLALMAVWGTATGVLVSTVLMGAGVGLLFPSLVLVPLAKTHASERTRVMATFTLFMDASAAVGPLTLGAIADRASYPVSLLAAAGFAAGTGVLALTFRRSEEPSRGAGGASPP